MKTEPAPAPSHVGYADSWEHYLSESATPRAMIEEFLTEPCWARFDAELGYTLQNNIVPFGMNGAQVIETFGADGARSRFMYAGRKPRINAYGDSFTECSQVNDGETWQEYLGAHLAEPIANFGVGGYGVYQAYRRMVREEATDNGAPYVILYIWGDDPTRSLMRARWPVIYPWFAPVAQAHRLFHGNFWSHLELDVDNGAFVERESPIKNATELFNMCDPDWMVERMRTDRAAHLSVFGGAPMWGMPGSIRTLNRKLIQPLADALGIKIGWDGDSEVRDAAVLLNLYGQRATCYILDKAQAYAAARGKTLLVALNATARSGEAIEPGKRNDQVIVDHLAEHAFNVFDMNTVHALEHAATEQSFGDYMERYLVGTTGHYNPAGNHFFAYAIKDALVRLLKPQPLPYRSTTENGAIDFKGYLPGYH